MVSLVLATSICEIKGIAQMYPGSKWARVRAPGSRREAAPNCPQKGLSLQDWLYLRFSVGPRAVYLHHMSVVAKAGWKVVKRYRLRPVLPTLGQNRPNDSGHFVGECAGDDIAVTASQQRL
jgi:hypothetical protein